MQRNDVSASKTNMPKALNFESNIRNDQKSNFLAKILRPKKNDAASLMHNLGIRV